MTVGEPEISLNTWGLKYVIKKQDGSIQVAGGKVGGGEQPIQARSTTPSESNINIQHEDTSSSTDESKIDTTTSFGGGHATRHASVGDQGVGGSKPVKESKAPSSKPSSNITNPKTSKRVPAQDQTHNSGTGDGSGAFTAEGKPTRSGSKRHGSATKPSSYESNTVRDESGKEVLSEAGNTKKLTVSDDSPKSSKYLGTSGGGVKNPSRDKKPEVSGKPDNTKRSPEHNNPVPEGKGSPKNEPVKIKPTTAAEQKKILASKKSLELAIIKCKLLKMKSDIAKGFGGEGRHTAGYLKEIEEGAQKFSKDGKTGGSTSTDASAKEYLESNKTRTGAKIPDEKLGDLPQGGQDNSGESTTTIEGADGKEKEIETGYKKWEKEQKKSSLDLAIEVINETIKSINIEKHHDGTEHVHPHVDRDTVDKDAAATTSTQGMANFVYSDVKEDKAKKNAEAKQ